MMQFLQLTIGHHKVIDPTGVVLHVNNIERTTDMLCAQKKSARLP